jgi:hypothetical protein
MTAEDDLLRFSHKVIIVGLLLVALHQLLYLHQFVVHLGRLLSTLLFLQSPKSLVFLIFLMLHPVLLVLVICQLLLQVLLDPFLSLFDWLQDCLVSFHISHLLDKLIIFVANCTDFHIESLIEVPCWCIDDVNLRLLGAINGILLDELADLCKVLSIDIVPSFSLVEPDVHMCGGVIINMKPNVLREGKLDELLILKLVLSLVDKMPIAGPVVEDHLKLLQSKMVIIQKQCQQL